MATKTIGNIGTIGQIIAKITPYSTVSKDANAPNQNTVLLITKPNKRENILSNHTLNLSPIGVLGPT